MNTATRITALIVDDELGACNTLAHMLKHYCTEVTLLGQAHSIDTAASMILALKPDIVFLDIEMPGGSGFELLDKTGATSANIIFTTAYSHYAIRAIKAAALDYLLKPIEITELKASIDRFRKQTTKTDAALYRLLQEQTNNILQGDIERMAVPSNDGYEIIDINQVMYCEGDSNYTTIYMTENTSYIIGKTLKEYERLLPKHKFVRVHQKFLINIAYAKKLIKGRGGTLVMIDGRHIAVSQNKRAGLIDLLLK